MVHCVSVHGGLGRTRVLSTKYNLKRAKSDDVLCSLFVIVVASVLGTYFYFMAPFLEIVRCCYLDCFVLRSYWYHAIRQCSWFVSLILILVCAHQHQVVVSSFVVPMTSIFRVQPRKLDSKLFGIR